MDEYNEVSRKRKGGKDCWCNNSTDTYVRLNYFNFHIPDNADFSGNKKRWDCIPISQCTIGGLYYEPSKVVVDFQIALTDNSTDSEKTNAKDMHSSAVGRIATILKSKGFAVETKNDRSNTVLHISLESGARVRREEILKILGDEGIINNDFVNEVLRETYPKFFKEAHTLQSAAQEIQKRGYDPVTILEAAIEVIKRDKNPVEILNAAQRIVSGNTGTGKLGR